MQAIIQLTIAIIPLRRKCDRKCDIMNREFVYIPLSLFADRKLAVLESIVRYLHEEKGFTFREISLMLNRNERTIYTAYRRYIDKKHDV